MLVIRDLSSGYGNIGILRSVSLEVPEGSVVALVGPNGAGKSTLLRTIAGSLPAQGGSINFLGTEIAGKPAYTIARRGLLLVPEGRQILGKLSVLDNLLLGKLAIGHRESGTTFDLPDIYDLFPRLKERRDQVAGSLSGGEQQMLAIGRALMGHPRLLLLDEPSLGLAPVIVDQVFAALHRLREAGIAMIVVEQRIQRVLDLADYGYVLERGRIVTKGESGALMRDPEIANHYLGL